MQNPELRLTQTNKHYGNNRGGSPDGWVDNRLRIEQTTKMNAGKGEWRTINIKYLHIQLTFEELFREQTQQTTGKAFLNIYIFSYIA